MPKSKQAQGFDSSEAKLMQPRHSFALDDLKTFRADWRSCENLFEKGTPCRFWQSRNFFFRSFDMLQRKKKILARAARANEKHTNFRHVSTLPGQLVQALEERVVLNPAKRLSSEGAETG